MLTEIIVQDFGVRAIFQVNPARHILKSGNKLTKRKANSSSQADVDLVNCKKIRWVEICYGC